MQIRLQKLIILSLFIASPAYASSGSWFASDSAPSAYPSSFSSWTPAQYSSFEQTFSSLRENTFDAWDESRLREWLLEQGIVAPKGHKEELTLAAKRRWRDWEAARDRYSASASEIFSGATASASEASASVSSYAAQATNDILPDNTKEFIWSTWDDTELRKYLVEKGIIDNRTAAGKKRDELIRLAQDHYSTAQGNAWEMWSDSYIVRILLRPFSNMQTDYPIAKISIGL